MADILIVSYFRLFCGFKNKKIFILLEKKYMYLQILEMLHYPWYLVIKFINNILLMLYDTGNGKKILSH